MDVWIRVRRCRCVLLNIAAVSLLAAVMAQVSAQAGTLPAQATPQAALAAFHDGEILLQSATGMTQYQAASQYFQQAIKLAPGWGPPYYDLAVAQDLAGQYDAAEASLRAFLDTQPPAEWARKAQDRIYELDAKRKIAAAAAAQTQAADARQQAKEQDLERNAAYEGHRYNCSQPLVNWPDITTKEIALRGYYWFRVEQGNLHLYMTYTWKDAGIPGFANAPLGTGIVADQIHPDGWPPHLTGAHTTWSTGVADFSGGHLTVTVDQNSRAGKGFSGADLPDHVTFECESPRL